MADENNNELKNYTLDIESPAFVDYSEKGFRVQNKNTDITFITLIGAQNKMLMINNQTQEKTVIPYSAFLTQMEVLGLNPNTFFDNWYNSNFQE